MLENMLIDLKKLNDEYNILKDKEDSIRESIRIFIMDNIHNIINGSLNFTMVNGDGSIEFVGSMHDNYRKIFSNIEIEINVDKTIVYFTLINTFDGSDDEIIINIKDYNSEFLKYFKFNWGSSWMEYHNIINGVKTFYEKTNLS